jgi:hypothetical protein
MNLFLAELSQAVAPGAQGIVLMDTAGELCVPENLSLVFLPPYSPEPRWRGGSGRKVLCPPIVLPRSNRAGRENGALSPLS